MVGELYLTRFDVLGRSLRRQNSLSTFSIRAPQN
jgi:hypothetical protein